MYRHNSDRVVYSLVFYSLLTVIANIYLWVFSSKTAYVCA